MNQYYTIIKRTASQYIMSKVSCHTVVLTLLSLSLFVKSETDNVNNNYFITLQKLYGDTINAHQVRSV